VTGPAFSQEEELAQLAADFPGWKLARSGGRLVGTCLPLTGERLDPPDGRTTVTASTIPELRAALEQARNLIR